MFRTLAAISGLAIFLVLATQVAVAQDPSPQAPPPSPAPSPGGSPTTGGGSPSIPGTTPGRPSPFPDPSGRPGQFPDRTDPNRFPDQMQQPLFLSGKVVMDDGTPPPDSVVIESICNGQIRPQAYTDSKGRFNFQWGQNSAVMPDASISSGPDGMPGSPGMGGMGNMGTMGRGGRMDPNALMGCELRASLAGYRSEMVNLAGRRAMDNPDVGTIVLRRLGNVEGLTISGTMAMAPKDARKAFDKGREAARKQKWADARKEFDKATTLYPKFANAWYELGRVHEAENRVEDARKAYESALAQDPKLVTPYVQLAFIQAREGKWQDVADISDRAIKLNPFDYPQAYFVNAVANLNLQKIDAAEKSAIEADKLDTQHRIPKIKHVLGVILAQKQDYAGAREQLNGFLKLIPENAPDAANVRKQLAEIDKLSSAQPAARTP